MHPNHVSISSLKQQSKNKGKEHKLEHEYEARARTEHDGMGRAPPDQELV